MPTNGPVRVTMRPSFKRLVVAHLHQFQIGFHLQALPAYSCPNAATLQRAFPLVFQVVDIRRCPDFNGKVLPLRDLLAGQFLDTQCYPVQKSGGYTLCSAALILFLATGPVWAGCGGRRTACRLCFASVLAARNRRSPTICRNERIVRIDRAHLGACSLRAPVRFANRAPRRGRPREDRHRWRREHGPVDRLGHDEAGAPGRTSSCRATRSRVRSPRLVTSTS